MVAGNCNRRAEARGGESEVRLGQHKTLPQNQATQNKKSTVATCVLSFLFAVLYISCRHVASPKTQGSLALRHVTSNDRVTNSTVIQFQLTLLYVP